MAVEASAIRGMHLQADSFNPVRKKKGKRKGPSCGMVNKESRQRIILHEAASILKITIKLVSNPCTKSNLSWC